MALVDCGRGHLYDSDLYPSCPYCNGGGNEVSFGGGGGIGATAPVGGFGGGFGGTELMNDFSSIGGTAPVGGGFGGGYAGDQFGNSFDNGFGGGSDSDAGLKTSIGKTSPVGYNPPGGMDSTGATVAPEGYRKRNEAQNKTVALGHRDMSREPVVGWLVCIEGPEKGKDYRLYDRQNTIGRSERMDVCIESDKAISRENHARIAYEPRHNNFTIIPGESTNNIYLNGQPIYVPTILNPYDVLEFGESKFLLVAFCCDRFNWNEGLRNPGPNLSKG